MENIKDFIRRDIKVEKVEEEVKAVKTAPAVEYTVKVVSGPDFVINKKTARTDKDFAFIVSAKQYYIRDNNKNKDDEVDREKTRKFFAELRDSEVELKSTCIKKLNKINLEVILNAIEDSNFANFLSCQYDIDGYSDLIYFYNAWKISPKLFKEVYKVFGNYKANYDSNPYENMHSLNKIYEAIGVDKTRLYLEKLNASPLTSKFLPYYYYGTNMNQSNFYNILATSDCKRVCEYIFFESYTKGYTSLASFVNEWMDTLKMQEVLYKKIKNKYPMYLQTEHDILTLKYNLVKQKFEEELFKESVNLYKGLEYKGKKYSIIIPECTQDLVEEGVNLSHCVKTYIGKVAERNCCIVFLRDNKSLEDSLVTIEVVGNQINQVKGYLNRRPTKEEEKFVEEWAKEKGLKYSAAYAA